MQVKTQSCVVAGKKTVAITDQNIEWNNKGTLVKITRGGICYHHIEVERNLDILHFHI